MEVSQFQWQHWLLRRQHYHPLRQPVPMKTMGEGQKRNAPAIAEKGFKIAISSRWGLP
jgi:hypothetical protein